VAFVLRGHLRLWRCFRRGRVRLNPRQTPQAPPVRAGHDAHLELRSQTHLPRAGHDTALAAVERLAETFPDRTDEWRAKKLLVLEARYRYARRDERADAGQSLLAEYVDLAENHAAENRPAEALDLLKKAYTVGRAVRSPRVKEIVASRKRIETAVAARRRAEARAKILTKRLAPNALATCVGLESQTET